MHIPTSLAMEHVTLLQMSVSFMNLAAFVFSLVLLCIHASCSSSNPIHRSLVARDAVVLAVNSTYHLQVKLFIQVPNYMSAEMWEFMNTPA